MLGVVSSFFLCITLFSSVYRFRQNETGADRDGREPVWTNKPSQHYKLLYVKGTVKVEIFAAR